MGDRSTGVHTVANNSSHLVIIKTEKQSLANRFKESWFFADSERAVKPNRNGIVRRLPKKLFYAFFVWRWKGPIHLHEAKAGFTEME